MKLSLLMVLVILGILAQAKPGSSSCGQSPDLQALSRSFGRIVGGVNVKDCTVIPWQVRLNIEMSAKKNILCGGSIISQRHVLTAAHCMPGVEWKQNVTVYLGDYNTRVTEEHERKSGIKNVTIHGHYNSSNFDSDIAILTLAEPISLKQECMQPVCVDSGLGIHGQLCIVSGWGATKWNGTGSRILKMVQVETHEGEACESALKTNRSDYVTHVDKMVCAGFVHGGKDSCQGDSGGPLVCWDDQSQSFVQVGIVSYGEGCAWEGFPGVYTRVSYFQDWINQVMQETP